MIILCYNYKRVWIEYMPMIYLRLLNRVGRQAVAFNVIWSYNHWCDKIHFFSFRKSMKCYAKEKEKKLFHKVNDR